MRFFGEYNKALAQLNLFKIYSFVLTIAIAILAIVNYQASNNSKIIITPPYVSSEFENVGDNFSYSYYEQIGVHLSNALLTISPSNVNRTFDSIQGYFSSDPDDIQKIKEYLIEEAGRIKKDNIFQAFYYLKTVPNYKHNSFTVEGLLKSLTGNTVIDEKKARITFYYTINNKKLVIKAFDVEK